MCSRCEEQPKASSSSYCRECRNAYWREYRKAGRRPASLTPEAVRRRQMRYLFGIDPEDYDVMHANQQGRCAICASPELIGEDGQTRRLAVDHDRRCCPGKRSCGKCVRGLLCFSCNTGIGKLGDDANRLLAAAAYLIKGDKTYGSIDVVKDDPRCTPGGPR